MSGEWKLVNYDCQDGDCLMIWHSGKDSKLGALSLNHRSIGEAIIKELNRLENKNTDINSYVETVEESNTSLKRIRDELQKENKELKQENKKLLNLSNMKKGALTSAVNQLTKENKELKELIQLIAKSDSIYERNSVKEILKDKIEGLDTVAEIYASAWHDYVLLSNFFHDFYDEVDFQ